MDSKKFDGIVHDELQYSENSKSEEDDEEEEESCDRSVSKFTNLLKLRGYFLALIAAFASSLASIFVRKAHLFSGSEQTFIRYLLSLIILVPLTIFWKRLNIFGEKSTRSFLVARGIFGCIALITITTSFKLINPSDATAIFYANIVVVSVLARIFLKEKMTIICLISILLSIFGILMITQPSIFMNKSEIKEELDFDCNDNTTLINSNNDCTRLKSTNENKQRKSFKTLLGVLLALICVFCASAVQILLKKLANKNVHFTVTTLYTSYFGIPLTLIVSVVLISFGYADNPLDIDHKSTGLTAQILFMIAGALFGLMSQSSMNAAFAYEDAIKISILKTTELPFTFLGQYFLLGISPNSINTIGAALIIIASLILMIFKFFDTKQIKKKAEKRERKLLENNNQQQQDKTFINEMEYTETEIKIEQNKKRVIKKVATRIIFFKF
jgi:drug/metabolite transporter (DMT)-like permease